MEKLFTFLIFGTLLWNTEVKYLEAEPEPEPKAGIPDDITGHFNMVKSLPSDMGEKEILIDTSMWISWDGDRVCLLNEDDYLPECDTINVIQTEEIGDCFRLRSERYNYYFYVVYLRMHGSTLSRVVRTDMDTGCKMVFYNEKKT